MSYDALAFTRMSNKYSSRGNKYLFPRPFKYVPLNAIRTLKNLLLPSIYYGLLLRFTYKNRGGRGID